VFTCPVWLVTAASLFEGVGLEELCTDA